MGTKRAASIGRGRAWDHVRVLYAVLLVCPPASVAGQENLSFEVAGNDGQPVAWELRDDSSAVTVDATAAASGRQSLRIERTESGRTRVLQRFPVQDLPGNRLRLRARARLAAFTGNVGLWLRLDATDGLLYVDVGGRAVDVAGEWTLLELQAPQFPDAAVVTIGASADGSGTIWIDDFTLEGVMTSMEPAAPRAAAFLDEALDLLERHAWRRAAIDWASLRIEARAQAAGAVTTADTYLALRYALGRLGDRHSYLLAPRQAASLAAAPVSNARTRAALQSPRAHSLPPDVAYLWLPGFAGGSHGAQVEFATQVQALIAELDDQASCGWVLDLRDNEGGNLWPMLVGVGPLLGDREAGSVVYADGREQSYWYRGGRAGLGEFVQLRVDHPYVPSKKDKPVALLLGGQTASSAESLAVAFAGRPRTRSFGGATRGLATATRTIELSDGSALVLAVAASRGADGAVHVGPLEPDQPVYFAPEDARRSGQAVVEAARGWLRGECARPPA